MATLTRVTPDDLLVLPDGKEFELVDGELVEKHVTTLTSYLETRLAFLLTGFVDAGRLGSVFGPSCGFRCFPHKPEQVRRPDVAFVSKARLNPSEIGDGWCTIAPDLAVEVVSPNDNASDLEIKLEDYADAGIPVVWVIYPESRTVVIHRPDGSSIRQTPPVELVGEGPLAGFCCQLDDLFPPTLDDADAKPADGNGAE